MPNGTLNNRNEENLFDIIDHLPWVVCVYDPDTRVIMVNRALCSYFQIRPEDWLGKTARQLIDEGYMDRTTVTDAVEKRDTVFGITRYRTGIETVTVCRPIFEENGDIRCYLVSAAIMQDLEEMKAAFESQRHLSDLHLRELEHLRNFLILNREDIVASPHMKSILETVKKISRMDSTVFVTGETGVGKEVIAKIIHNNSVRRYGPFIPINISSLPETLLESELYGYKAGAFTGALKEGKVGLFEVAKGGTLFLDEVADIPIGMQSKILRAIETGEITKIGDIKPQKIDVRIIAATHRDIKSEIRKGNFREDLYYRLNVVPIRIDPLRKRPEDIWPLCTYFLERIDRKYGLKKTFSSQALQELRKYQWPGNVRELRNVVERLAILSTEEEISADDFRNLIGTSVPEKESLSASDAYEDHEQERILSALKQAKGNKSKAAEFLGVSRSKLYRMLRK